MTKRIPVLHANDAVSRIGVVLSVDDLEGVDTQFLLGAFAMTLSREDVVVIEATGNASSVAAVIAPHVKKVVIANPKQVRIIAHAKAKTDSL